MTIFRFHAPVAFIAASTLTVVALLTACSGKSDTGAGAPSAAASAPATPSPGPTTGASGPVAGAPPVSVTTAKATKKDFGITIKATGTVTPLSSVDVKAQVTSVVTNVAIKEGQFVKAGDLLFTLDSRTDEANLAKAKAQLAKDEASLADAKRQLTRNQELVAKAFISQGAADTSQSNVDALVATVAADKATLDAANTALSYNRITAAQSGRVGVINVFVGSAVQANLTTMVTITQLDPIAVAFNLPQGYLSDALAALRGTGTLATAKLPDNAGVFKGALRFIDSAVDPATGTVKMKAIFPNKDSKLWPGGYADVTLTSRTIKDAIVVPQVSIVQNARGTIVYIVKDGKAVLRPVKVVFSQGEEAAVTGVQADEVIVVDGRQNIRPNSPVIERAKPTAPGTPGAPAAPPATGASSPRS